MTCLVFNNHHIYLIKKLTLTLKKLLKILNLGNKK